MGEGLETRAAASPAAILEVEVGTGRIRCANAGAARLTGWRPDALVGRPFVALLDAGLAGQEAPLLAGLLGDPAGPREGLLHLLRHDGTRCWVRVSGGRGEAANGDAVVVVLQDVDALQRDRERLEWMAAIVASADEAIISKGLDGRVRSWNGAAERMLGFSAGEMLGEPVLRIVPEAHRGEEPEILARICRSERVERFRTERRSKDGALLPASISVSPVRDASGTVVGAATIMRDLRNEYAAERALRTSEARERTRALQLTTMMDVVPAVVFFADTPDARAIQTNRAGSELLRLPKGANVSLSAPPGEAPSHFRVFADGRELAPEALPVQRAARGEQIRDFEMELRFRDGHRRHLLGNAVPWRDPDGGSRGSVAAFVDITDRKRAEEALIRQETTLQKQLTRERLIASVSRRFVRLHADAAHDVIAATVREIGELLHADCGYVFREDPERGRVRADIGWRDASAPDGPPAHPEIRIADHPWLFERLRGGETLVMPDAAALPEARTSFRRMLQRAAIGAAVMVPLLQDRELRGLLAFCQIGRARSWDPEDVHLLRTLADIVVNGWSRAEADQALREAARHRDEFLATLAHELRNPLAPIRTGVDLIRAIPGEDARERAADLIGRQVTHLAHLVDDLTDLSRVAQGRLAVRLAASDLRPLVEQALEMHRETLESQRQALRVELPDAPVPVRCDGARIVQVISNLLTNASRYTPEGGHIDLTLRAADGEARLTVADDGRGIAPDLLRYVFDIFVQGRRTLAREEGGLGIGLTLVRRIVEIHGGRVDAASEGIGRGASFLVALPLLRAGAPSPGPASSERRSPAAQAAHRVVVVDDNRDSADALAFLLERLGHRVRVAYEGHGGLAAVREERPELVLCDIGLPGLDGYELARRVRRDPSLGSIRLVALTGYGQEDDRREALRSGFDEHVLKPLGLERLRRILGELQA